MKIMFIVYHDIPTEARSQEILECAKRLGEDVVLVSYSTPENKDGVRCIVTGRGQRRYFPFIYSAIRAIIRENPNVVFLHDNYSAAVLWWLQKYRKDITVIYDSSELYIDGLPRSVKEWVALHMRYLEERYLKCADVVIAANQERARIMKDYFQLREMPIVFDNIHRIDDVFDEEALDEKYGHIFLEGEFFVLYAGGVSEKRLTFELVNAAGGLGDKFQLVICGSASKQDLHRLDDTMGEKGWSNVHYLGFVSRGELRYLLRKSHINVSAFTQHSLNSIFCASGKLYEGLFEGKPVLVSSNPPLKRLCEETGVGISTDDFRHGILELYRNYDWYRNNVESFLSTIDYEKRLDDLVLKLKDRIFAG